MNHTGRRRLIHRRGAIFGATLQPSADRSDAGPRSALVRISLTFGWPRPLPDWTGLGIRLFAAGTGANPADLSEPSAPSAATEAPGPDGQPLDLLLASAATAPDLWCRLEAHRDVLGCSFTSAVRHRIDGRDQVVVAVPAEPRPTTLDELLAGRVPGPIRYRLDVTEHRGSWQTLGELVLTEQHDDDRVLRLAPPSIGPRWFTTTRRVAYRLAQGPAAR
jgi:hypothetical protein